MIKGQQAGTGHRSLVILVIGHESSIQHPTSPPDRGSRAGSIRHPDLVPRNSKFKHHTFKFTSFKTGKYTHISYKKQAV